MVSSGAANLVSYGQDVSIMQKTVLKRKAKNAVCGRFSGFPSDRHVSEGLPESWKGVGPAVVAKPRNMVKPNGLTLRGPETVRREFSTPNPGYVQRPTTRWATEIFPADDFHP